VTKVELSSITKDHHFWTPGPVEFDHSLPTVLQWAEGCHSRHPECSQGNSAMPTGVVYVESGEPRLFVPPESLKEAYLALSHC